MATKENKESVLRLRISKREMAKIKWLATTYAGGNVSKWARHALLEAPRKMLNKKAHSERGIKRQGPKKA